MDNKFIENWQEYSKSALTAAKELEAINTQIVEKFTGKQLELANAAFEVGTKYLSSLSEVKGYQELLAEQTKLVTEFNEKFIETAKDRKAHIVALSALLTTTMPSMKTTIDAFRRAGLRDQVRIFVGGAPVTRRFAEEIGADGYSETAPGAVALARQAMAGGA